MDIDIDDLERKKKWLKRYRRNNLLILRLEDKIKNLDDRIYGIKSGKISDLPRGGQRVTLEDLIAEKYDLKDRIDNLKAKGRKYKLEIIDKIDELEDVRYVEILESFFIGCKDFNEISNDSGYTERHIIRLYSKAITKLNI